VHVDTKTVKTKVMDSNLVWKEKKQFFSIVHKKIGAGTKVGYSSTYRIGFTKG
jgi:hypothetical protein